MNSTVQYLNYTAYDDDGIITVADTDAGVMARVRPVAFVCKGGERVATCELEYRGSSWTALRTMTAVFCGKDMEFRLRFQATRHGVAFSCIDYTGECVAFELGGTVGTAENAAYDGFAVAINGTWKGFRSAVGPATSVGDNAIFDRVRGVATVLSENGDGACPPSLRLKFDYSLGEYRFSYVGHSLYISLRARLFEDLFNVNYRPINKHSTFPSPPSGWMSWYALKFKTSEESVLRNAEFMKNELYDYGADTLWVDWEWQNTALAAEGPPDVDFFNPIADRYPNGMAHVSQRISELGLIPALWVGFTHEQGECEFIRRHPETVIDDKVYWYGKYIFDPSNPTWKREYLLPAARAVVDWGYRAMKWDCLASTVSSCDRHFARLYDKTKGSAGALKEAVTLVREELGEDFYMLACAGEELTVRFAADLFDGARVGGDVFHWQSFLDTIKRLSPLYPLHNTMLYCDPDNLIVREDVDAERTTETNSLDEARVRAAFVSLLGLPVTLGDDLPALAKERLDLCRRALPAIDAHPCDIRDYTFDGDTLCINLAVAKPFGTWNTVALFNLSDEQRTVTASCTEDLRLTAGKYHLYDFFKDEYLGITECEISAELSPRSVCVLRVTPVTDAPTVVASSRHISMGVPDLLSLSFDGNTVKGRSAVVANDDYTVAIYNPKNKTVTKHKIPHDTTGEVDWTVTL